MGQGQSSQGALQNREPTPEPADPEEARRFREEKARLREEERARRAAAVEQRLASQQKKKSGAGANASATPSAAAPKRKETALEQMSRENKGWRDADQQADLRAWN